MSLRLTEIFRFDHFNIMLATLWVLSLSAQAAVSFTQGQTYPVGTNPQSVAVADFNSDGKVDLAVMNFGDPTVSDSGSVSLLLGNGDGTFQAASTALAGTNPTAIGAADVNGDGVIDVLTTNSDNTVSVLLGNGNGTFQGHVDYSTATGPSSLAIGDFNADGHSDLAVGNSGAGISVLLGNGDGTFQSRVDYTTGGAANDVHTADFNRDGKPDLAVTVNGTVVILAGNGDGSFTSLWTSPALGIIAYSISIGDLTSDGIPDLIVAVANFGNATASSLVLLQGQGDGTFSQANGPNTGACVNRWPQLADFDGDGDLDVAAWANDGCLPSPKYNPRIVVLAGDGAGGFGSPTTQAVNGALGLIGRSDLNGDASPDLILLGASGNSVDIFLNNLGTNFSISAAPLKPSTLTAGQSATSTVSLSLLNAFNHPVSLACTVQPAQVAAPTCSLSSTSVAFDANGKATVMLTINTSGASSFGVTGSSLGHILWLPMAGLAYVGGLGITLSRKRKTVILSVLGLALCSILISQTACGAGSSSSSRATNYTIMVTGVAGATQHSTTVMLMVK